MESSQKVGVGCVLGGQSPPKTHPLPHFIERILLMIINSNGTISNKNIRFAVRIPLITGKKNKDRFYRALFSWSAPLWPPGISRLPTRSDSYHKELQDTTRSAHLRLWGHL
jgi:hypothetical protein